MSEPAWRCRSCKAHPVRRLLPEAFRNPQLLEHPWTSRLYIGLCFCTLNRLMDEMQALLAKGLKL